MAEGPGRVRLRQAVWVAAELEPAAQQLRDALALQEPFNDPGVGMFGLHNAVFALGDRFLEVVSPTQPGTAAGRYLERHGGDGGYMVIFDLEDLDGARQRAASLGVRVVWQLDLPDISGTHLHPADMRGAIVSIDRSNPFGSWRWGGPQWTGRIAQGAPGRLAGITVAVADPQQTAARWAEVLGVAVEDAQEGPQLLLEDAHVRFCASSDPREQGIVEVCVGTARELKVGEIAGVRLTRAAAGEPLGAP
jgi:hypothetical protein